jgi:hypothetical protein
MSKKDVGNYLKNITIKIMSKQIKIELSFTMEEMENFLLYNYPTNYHWKDRVKKDVMVYGNDIVVEDIKEEFVKCFKQTLLSQKLNGSRQTVYRCVKKPILIKSTIE